MEAGRHGPELVGRAAALAVAGSCVAAAVRGRGRTLLVAGEPGIGKTALVGEICAQAAADGALVLWGQCWDDDGAPAYWPWVQVIRSGTASGADAGDAARLLPEHRPAAAPAELDDAARFQSFDAVAGMLSGLARRRTVVVVLDDLHWADEGSLRLLEFASRHLSSSAVLLLGAYRDEQAGGRLRRLAAASDRLALPGLGRSDVSALLAGVTGTTPTVAVATDVWRRTGGNPFLVRELAGLLMAAGTYASDAVAPPSLLDSVDDILGRRLARLSQACTDVLTVAAVAGPEVRLELLAEVAGAADSLPSLLDEAVHARVLAPSDPPLTTLRFSHDLFRETVLAGLPPARRAALHLAIGRALESLRGRGLPVAPAELAHHFGAAAAAAPHETVRYSLLAGAEAAGRLAFEEGLRHAERALAALETATAPDAAERLEVLLRAAESRDRAGAPGAGAAYREAAGVARALGDAAGLARAALGLHSLGWRESHAESIDLLQQAVRALPEEPSALRSRVLAGLARDLHHAAGQRDWDRARALAEQAVADARQLDDPGTLAFCLLALHDARWRPGTAADRLPVISEMVAAAEAAGDRDLALLARLLRATALLELGYRDGLVELDAYCRSSEAAGHARARYGATSRRATAALVAGRLDEAAQAADEALALGRAIGEPDARGVYETLLWAVRRVGGTWHVPALDSDPWPALPLAEGVVALAGGRLDDARGAAARLLVDGLPDTHDLEMLAFAAELVSAAGTAQQQRALYAMLLPYSGTHIVAGGCASYFGAVDHYLGLLARSLADEDRARSHFAAAATLHDRLGAPAWSALSRRLAGTGPPAPVEEPCELRREGGVWTLRYRGVEAHLPDVKGLHDLAVLVATPNEAVHAVQLHTGHPPQGGADEVLDDRAKAAYRRRLSELACDIDEAESDADLHRAERARLERDALVEQLSAAVGRGGRDRRLGDDRERARKAVTARVREAISRIDRAHPALGEHLRGAVQTGTWCVYAPTEPVRWRST